MNTIIEKIRAEVERRMKKLHCALEGPSGNDGFLSFLSDLEKECEDFPTTDEEMEKFLATHPKVEFPEKYKTPDWMFEKSEKPTTAEGLEEEIENYLDHAELKAKCNGISAAQDYFDDLTNIARHFAQWGAEHSGSSEIPNDFEEAAVEYSAIGYSPFDDPYEKNQQFECSKFAFIAGEKWQMKKDLSSINKSYESGVVFGMNAQKEQDDKELSEKIASAYQLGLADKEKQMMKDGLDAVKSGQSSKIEKTIAGVFVKYGMDRQKEQMMKEAVEGKVVTTNKYTSVRYLSRYGTFRYFYGIGRGYQKGDKVKLIIIKED